jgi:hypothetical protein
MPSTSPRRSRKLTSRSGPGEAAGLEHDLGDRFDLAVAEVGDGRQLRDQLLSWRGQLPRSDRNDDRSEQ